MELLNQQPLHKIILKVEEIRLEGIPPQFPNHCAECFHVIPVDVPQFRRLPCKCKFHSHCLLRIMMREGVVQGGTQAGTFPCKHCISRELSRGISSQCSI